MRDWAFSPPASTSLDRGKGDKDAVITPQVPTRRAVGHTVFDHEADRQIDHPVGIMTAGWGQVSEVGAKILATRRTVML